MSLVVLATWSTMSEAKAPSKVGACTKTTVAEISSRLVGMPESGSAVSFRNGVFQVSYDVVPDILKSRIGDPALVCLVSVPTDCPKGDNRGKVYATTNLRTGGGWILPDAEHSCGGA